jgi:uncharacterized DUF497 family protein
MIRFEWDPVKARTNYRKHGVTFEDATFVFDDPSALFEQDRTEGGEERWQALGLTAGVVLLLVIHTVRGEGNNEIIRLISARQANRRENERYAQTCAKDAR